MRVTKRFLLSLCAAGSAVCFAQAPPAPPKVTVRVFLSPDCPISNAYAPELKRLQQRYAPQGVAFDAVYVGDNKAAMREHAAQFDLTGYRVVPDTKQVAARRAGVRVTPEVAVFDAKNQLRYRGRIDDRFAAPGVRRATVQEASLRVAVDALLAGKAVKTPRTRAVGCLLPAVSTKKKS